MNEIKLKPCPFCGGEARRYYGGYIRTELLVKNVLQKSTDMQARQVQRELGTGGQTMSKEKQIDELYNDVNEIFEEDYREHRHITAYHTAKHLYERGYRKQSEGEWITDEEGYVTCSVCGEEHTWDEFRPPYCDMCGAKMKGGAG